MSGMVEADAETLAEAGATARLEVDMAKFDAGDWLKNRKLKGDMQVDRHPTATFDLERVSDVRRLGDGSIEARAAGTLRWRNREVKIDARGKARMDDRGIDASGEFDLDVRDVDIKPWKFLMLKVEEIVSVKVTLRGNAA